eukprot:196722-Rhodomonas_salina.1
MHASKHLVTLDKQQGSLTTSPFWDPATGDQLLQHHYRIPIDVVDTDAPEASDTHDNSVEVPVQHTHQTRSQSSAGAADLGSAGAASGSASSASHTQSALKPSCCTQYNVTGAGDNVPLVPPLSGSTSTSIQHDKHSRSVTGGKTANKRQRNVTFNLNYNYDKDWEACSDTPIGQVPDYDLAVYLCKTSTQLRMPKEFWPDDGGKWIVECMSVEQISTYVFLY